ncbi:MAG: sensor domain-containing diguanylate cyclase [Candidatus Omnitrophica bacterium]|nr:sensor domain-containing diguanylate cyclase [Candidatus Omnitrophota bacterium]
MIKIPKKELYNAFLFLLLVSLPVIFYYFRQHFNKKNSLRLKKQDLQEKINILTDENSRALKTRLALQEKISRYNNLKSIIETLNQSLDLEFISRSIVEAASSLIAREEGTVLLYTIDEAAHKPVLFKSKKQDAHQVIRAKEGDIFDFWVLRHSSPLLVEDIKKDFRFDPEKLKHQDLRPVCSLISAPLVSQHRLLGILRIDHQAPGSYSQDDLRLLSAISDLGAVALENAEVFAETKDLAIHDALTGLYTKGYFLDRLKEEGKRVMRSRTGFSLLMLDVDYFKKYNDKFGHSAGDIVLKQLARLMTEALKDYQALICRFGGEEFCILLNRVEKKQAKEIAEGLCAQISSAKVVLRRQETFFNVSIGVAAMFEDALSEDELIFKADKALLLAKQQGRNRVACA